jgi:hypothetical protein
MQDLIWDAVPAQRKKKEELFSTPVMTMSAIEKVGAGRKFSFNKAAQEAMGIKGEGRISFGFSADGKQIFVRKAEGEEGFKLTQACTISDKKTYEFVVKRLSLNTDAENHFDVVPMAGFFQLVLKEDALKFETTQIGEVSDEEDLDADLSSIPTAPEGGVMYSEAATEEVAEIEEVEEVEEVEEENFPTTEDSTDENSEEDVW